MKSTLTIREALRLWLGGYGMSFEQSDEVLNHPRMELSLQMCDAGGVLMDLPRVLGSLHHIPQAFEAYRKLSTAEEQFLLMQVLQKRPERSPRQAGGAFVLSLFRNESQDTWSVRLGDKLTPIDGEQAGLLFDEGKVTRWEPWCLVDDMNESKRLSDALPERFEQFLVDQGACPDTDAKVRIRCANRQSAAAAGVDSRYGQIQVDVTVPSYAYIAFFEGMKQPLAA